MVKRSKANEARTPGPIAVQAGAALGALGGVALGSMQGAAGALLGLLAGGAAGLVAGRVLAREAARAEARDRELDAEIGITRGSLGAGPVRFRPEPAELDPWGQEWLTPPPPRV
jgi:hypothetical protein